jgi:hypothetical protein
MCFDVAGSRKWLKLLIQNLLAGWVSLDGFLRGRVPVKFGTGHVPTMARNRAGLARGCVGSSPPPDGACPTSVAGAGVDATGLHEVTLKP